MTSRAVRVLMTSRAVRILATLAVCIAAASSSAATAPAGAATCGTLALSSTKYTHVVWIWMENHSYSEIIGSSEAPYINGLAGECGLATNYHNVSHPSLPNYIAGTSGLPFGDLKKFDTDCSPSRKCSTAAQSVFGQIPSWKAYEESMPSNCDRSNSGEYAVRHNPPPYYTKLAECATKDVPYTQLSDLERTQHMLALEWVLAHAAREREAVTYEQLLQPAAWQALDPAAPRQIFRRASSRA